MGAILRVEDRWVGDAHRVVVSLNGAQESESTVALTIDAAEAELVRWYLEDYAEFQADPAPQIARDAETVLASIGHALHRAVFDGPEAVLTWATAVAGGLGTARVEVDADATDVPGLPWELLREPRTDQPLVLGAAEFVRTHRRTARPVVLPHPREEPLRVLMVICRPGGQDDVSFRSVASGLVRAGADRMDGLKLDVLRPPTFAQLGVVLRAAAAAGRPYHVLHFDGHGAFLDASTRAGNDVPIDNLRFGTVGTVREGRHGYLVFEGEEYGQVLVNGPTLAALLVETTVPVLVLNACRSAYAEAPSSPAAEPANATVHDRIRAYGSLAAEVADAGVPGVVAMRYNVYVVTAAQFVANLYAHLVAGRSLGAAATLARKALAASPSREVGPSAVELQDWVVPTVYELAPLHLRTVATAAPLIRITVDDARPAIDLLPAAPDVGFFGRDETLLALDRAFDDHRIVLLHALAGAGKSTTAAEFTRWYAATGGLDGGPVLWTSFEHYFPLPRVLDVVGTAFAEHLECSNIQWAAITDVERRRRIVLQVLGQVPVLWVWDNVEPVAGFPTGTTSAWSPQEQQELVEFLRAVRDDTQAKVLLTSRRTEDAWLSRVAVRVSLPPMPIREQLQLARAVARHHAPYTPPRGAAVDWLPLLRFTGGNPLTIDVAVRQAVRESVATTEEVVRFVERVQIGHTGLETADDSAQGRDASLASSLAYGFDQAFTEAERTQLAVLHLFRDTVDVEALLLMGDPEVAEDDAVPALRGINRDKLIALLDRAVEVGLLSTYGASYYGIHPALPWFFSTLFTRLGTSPDQPQRAYLRAYAAVAGSYLNEVRDGRQDRVLPALRIEESNLRHALALARTHSLPEAELRCLDGIHLLYERTGRDIEWARLLDAVASDYVDPINGRPHAGREMGFEVVTRHLVDIARSRRDWPAATRLQEARTVRAHEEARAYRTLPPDSVDSSARHLLLVLAVNEQDLGRLLLDQFDPECLGHFQAAYDINVQIGSVSGQAIQSSFIGNAYLLVPGLHDLDLAEHWHRRNLALLPEDDRLSQAATTGSLGNIARQRFLAGIAAAASADVLQAQFTEALGHFIAALDLLPADHHELRATAHNQLGSMLQPTGAVQQALRHYQSALHHMQAYGNTYGAGQIRWNIARLYKGIGRSRDALRYLRAALADYRLVGAGAGEKVDEAEVFIARFEREIASERPSG